MTFAASLMAAPTADAAIKEVGLTEPFQAANCPTDCQAIGQVTGYQVQIGAAKNPYLLRREGRIVAFTIRVAAPNREQIDFFTRLFGGPPRVRLSVLRPARTARRHRLLAQSEVYDLSPYYGSTPTFALDRPLEITKRNVVALTVPTWAPAFAINLGEDMAWRSSRAGNACDDVQQQAAQQTVNSLRRYQCFYRTARLLYSATFIPNPKPTTEPEEDERDGRRR